MFCNSCGRPLVQEQNFCAHCGQPVGVAPIPRRLNRVAANAKVLGVLWIVYSLLDLLAVFAVLFASHIIFALHFSQPSHQPPEFLHPLLHAIAFLVLLKGIGSFMAGIGVTQFAPWGRIVALVMAFISLVNVPFGTALGIYTLWVLLPEDAEKEYSALAAAKA